jgi:hypothetical protein
LGLAKPILCAEAQYKFPNLQTVSIHDPERRGNLMAIQEREVPPVYSAAIKVVAIPDNELRMVLRNIGAVEKDGTGAASPDAHKVILVADRKHRPCTPFVDDLEP